MSRIKHLFLAVAVFGLMVGSVSAKIQFLPNMTDSDLGFSGNKIDPGHGATDITSSCMSGSTRACRANEIQTGTYKASNNDVCYTCRAGTAQDCVAAGFNLKDNFPKKTAFLERNRLGGSVFANIFNNIIGIKSAQAELTQAEKPIINECYDCGGTHLNPQDSMIPYPSTGGPLIVPDDWIQVPIDGGTLLPPPPATPQDLWSFRTDAVCPYDSNYVKGEWIKISKGPEDCLKEGYRLQSDWPKPTAALEIPKSNLLTTLFDNIIGIKSAHATKATSDDLMDTQINVIGGGGGGTSIRPVAGEQVKDKSDVTFDKGLVSNDKLIEKPDNASEAVLTFKTTAICPYDSRYVIGRWVLKR